MQPMTSADLCFADLNLARLHQILASPPPLLTSEAGVLAAQMGQVVLVVESETSTQRAVPEALRRREHCVHVSLICYKRRAFPGDDDDGHYD